MVKIYAMDVSGIPDPKEYPKIMEGLSKERIEKTIRYRQEKDRKQSLGAGLLLEKYLEEYGVCTEDISYGENGKPEVRGVYFNISHSGDMVICAISEMEVGCDIEMIRDVSEGIAERFFTDKEIEYLNCFEGKEKRNEFYRLWTMKESYMKMTGEGMSLALNRFEFEFSNRIKVYRDGELCDCNIKEYEIPEYKLTVCAKEPIFAETVTYVELQKRL